jgi:hypothetical protein
VKVRIPARPVPRPVLAAAAAALAAATSGLFAAAPAAAQTYTPLPAHIYAPYYETYLAPGTPGITATAPSGARYFTLAFLQSTRKGSCTLDWNGAAS